MADTGMIEVTGGRVWYEVLGDRTSTATPLLTLHGGPGAAHDYIRPFAERMAAHRPVVVYDQLGCGRSDRPDDTSLWTLDRFVEEVDQVRAALGLARCHLFGQSWGGWLAIEYLSRGDATTGNLASAILASTSSSLPQFAAEAQRLIGALPEPHRSVLRDLGAQGRYDDPDYLEAVDVFYRRHLCRLPEWPEAMQRSAEELDGNQVYLTMNGPTEFDIIGTLKDWDRTASLASFDLPVLVTCGRHDEITPACSQVLVDRIPGARLVVFEESSHTAHLEEGERYAAVAAEFLAAVDARPA